MDISEIKQIVKLMEAKGLTEFSFKDQNREFCLKRGNGEQPVVITQPTAPAIAPVMQVPEPVANESSENKNDDTNGLIEITSPIVGTFYRKPDPEKPNFANEGDLIGSDSVVCIVEAMKVMNEIKAEVSGKITKVLVDDGAPVQFGQPLFLVKPS